MKAKKVGIIGRKLGMTQMYVDGQLVGVTVVDFSDMILVGTRTQDKDGYVAAILGYDFKGVEPRYIREVRLENPAIYEDGQFLQALQEVKYVDVFGVMKGRGFAGVMKRHGFHGGPASHGAKHWHRRPGSIGGHTFPAKVWKGKKMPGHYGNTTVAVLRQQLVRVDTEKRLVYIKGAVPGARNSYVMLRDSVKE